MACSMVYSKSLFTNVVKTFPIVHWFLETQTVTALFHRGHSSLIAKKRVGRRQTDIIFDGWNVEVFDAELEAKLATLGLLIL